MPTQDQPRVLRYPTTAGLTGEDGVSLTVLLQGLSKSIGRSGTRTPTALDTEPIS